MVRGVVVLAVAIGASACGPERADRADLDELCGEAGPVQVLALAPDEMVSTVPDSVAEFSPLTHVGDRLVVVVHTYASELEASDPPGNAEPLGSRIVSVDDCGRDSIVLMDEAEELRVPDPPEAPWLACGRIAGERGLYRLDPTGETAAVRLRTNDDCPETFFVGDDVFVVDREDGEVSGPLVRHDRSGKAEVLLEQGIEWAAASGVPPAWDPFGDGRVLVILDGGELIELSPIDGTRETVASGVALYGTRGNGRFLSLVYDDAAETFEFRDRQTGSSASTSLASYPNGHVGFFTRTGAAGFYAYGPDESPSANQPRESGTTVVLRAADGLTTELPGDWQVFETLPSGLVVLDSPQDHAQYILDPGSSDPRWLEDFRAYYHAYEDGMIAYLEDPPDVSFSSPPTQDIPQALYHQPVDGSPRELVIDDVFQPLRLGDGRYVTVRGYAGDFRGELVLRDPDDDSVRVIDHDVHIYFARFAEGFTGVANHHTDTMSFVYPVRDPTHERTGLWRAQIER